MRCSLWKWRCAARMIDCALSPAATRARIFRDGALGVAPGGAVDHAVERELGRVADGRLDVADVDLGLAGGIERELVDLAARQGAVGAEPRQQQIAAPPA